MGQIVAQPNQSMFDLIIQGCGSAQAGMQFCADNGIGISDTPVVGQAYLVSREALGLGDAGVLQYLAQNGLTIGTLASSTPPLGFMDESGTEAFESEDGTEVFVEE